jgi:hypothetical protein
MLPSAADAPAPYTLLSQAGPDVAPADYLMTAWTRICEILGSEFAPYLPLVLPHLLQTVQQEATVRFLELGQTEDDLEGAPADWEIVPVADHRKIAINTAGLTSKGDGFNLLKIYIEQLGLASFAPHVENIAEIVLRDLAFIYCEKVRMRTVRVFELKFALEDAIGSHACSLEANMRVTNGIPLGSPLLIPVVTVNCVQTLKVRAPFFPACWKLYCKIIKRRSHKHLRCLNDLQ